jgi:hypothetical protein
MNICANPDCTKPLTTPRKLKSYCTYACRGQHRTLLAITPQTGLSGAKNTRQLKALRDLKSQSRGEVAFVRVNDVTIRVDAPNRRGAGWLMEVAWPGGRQQKWVARVGNRASEPMLLNDAKVAVPP